MDNEEPEVDAGLVRMRNIRFVAFLFFAVLIVLDWTAIADRLVHGDRPSLWLVFAFVLGGVSTAYAFFGRRKRRRKDGI
jgi:drug/metabolite transporter (DMT)-like permease